MVKTLAIMSNFVNLISFNNPVNSDSRAIYFVTLICDMKTAFPR